jgi:predicted nicotinamide N-methyase
MPCGANKLEKDVNQPILPAGRFLTGATLQSITLAGTEVNLYIPDPAAIQAAYRQGEIPFPYWSKVWPAAIALAEYLVQHPNVVKGKKVVELGAGLGLPSLVAARVSGPVLCSDYAPEAVELARASAIYNGHSNLETAVLDWNHLPKDLEVDVVLLSDINYDPTAFAGLLNLVNHFRERGTTLLLSTPQRLLAKDFISPLTAFCTRQEEHIVYQNGKQVPTTVMVIEGKK